MKAIIAVSLALALCGCQSAAERKAEWLAFCVKGEFTSAQCDVLYSLKESSDDANESAGLASAMSGVAVGMSAVNAGSRR